MGCLAGLGRYIPPDPEKKKRNVWHIGEHVGGDEVGVIVLDDDGEVWSNQTSGGLCDHPEAKGRYFCFDDQFDDDIDFANSFHDEICFVYPNGSPPTVSLMDKIDSQFKKKKLPMRVNRLVVHHPDLGLREAWIPVVLDDDRMGIFTYWNCD